MDGKGYAADGKGCEGQVVPHVKGRGYKGRLIAPVTSDGDVLESQYILSPRAIGACCGYILSPCAIGACYRYILSPLVRLAPAAGIFSLPLCDWRLLRVRSFHSRVEYLAGSGEAESTQGLGSSTRTHGVRKQLVGELNMRATRRFDKVSTGPFYTLRCPFYTLRCPFYTLRCPCQSPSRGMDRGH
eukprot:9493863-Pyramimonas_sp.AAC.1